MFQLDDSKSLDRKWLEITISIHLKMVGLGVPGRCWFYFFVVFSTPRVGVSWSNLSWSHIFQMGWKKPPTRQASTNNLFDQTKGLKDIFESKKPVESFHGISHHLKMPRISKKPTNKKQPSRLIPLESIEDFCREIDWHLWNMSLTYVYS